METTSKFILTVNLCKVNLTRIWLSPSQKTLTCLSLINKGQSMLSGFIENEEG